MSWAYSLFSNWVWEECTPFFKSEKWEWEHSPNLWAVNGLSLPTLLYIPKKMAKLNICFVLLLFLFHTQTRDGSDYMQVFMGTGTGGYHKLHFQTSHSTPYIWRDWSEFMSIFWHSDCCYTKDGIRANIWYYGKYVSLS